jgi:hypothetical protein
MLFSVTRHVGPGQAYSGLTQAIAVTIPGDTILVHQGNYAGGISRTNLQGTALQWIYIHAAPRQTVIFSGGTSAWQFSDAAFLHIRGFIFQHQTANGVNIDDGGTPDTPSHHLVFENCTFCDINATGNNDLLKLSGVDDFEIRNSLFLNGSPGTGDAIDMVGCHNGFIINCRFENMGAACVQAKGGSGNIRIEANLFKNGGQRSINLGGSTGLPFYRPVDAKYEATDLKVYSNVFIGSVAPVAFVGCIRSEVVNNTIYLPEKWVLRILQEKVDTSRFYPCGNNVFRNNIIYLDSMVSICCNTGPNTTPLTFTFSNNLWYHSQNTHWKGPDLPAEDMDGIIGKDPLFTDAAQENFSLMSGSPAVAKGYHCIMPQRDFAGIDFSLPRTIGAFGRNP